MFEEHPEDPTVAGTTIGSCYSRSTYFYTSFQCDTLKKNCFQDFCDMMQDPLYVAPPDAGRIAGIVVGSVIGSALLCVCCCGGLTLYYGGQYSYNKILEM